MSLFSVARNQEDAAAAAPAPGEDSEVEAKQVIGCFSNALGDYIREEDPELKQCLLIAERLTMLSNSLTHSSAVIEVGKK